MTDKLKKLLEGMGCSSSDIARITQELEDDPDAEDDLDEILPLKAGKPRDLRAEDMNTTDPFRKMRAYATAQDLVRRHTGQTIHANDAAGVLRKGLGLLGMSELDSGLPKSALPEVWRVVTRPNAAYAMDAAQTKRFNERFPEVARIRTAF